MLSTEDHPTLCTSGNHATLQAPRPWARERTDAAPPPPDARLYAAVLGAIDVGLVITTLDSTLLHANQAARRSCDGSGPLSLAGGRLHSLDSSDQQRLQQALLRAGQGRRAMLSLRHSDWTFTAGVVPLFDPVTRQQAALVMLGDPPRAAGLNLQFLCQTHRLTLAESAVLTALAQGLTPSEVAQRGGVSIATVRSQITAIREKTQTGSLAQLQRLVSSLPPLAPAGMHHG